MKYTDSIPRSAEILRLVLPNISKHGGSCVPTAYAIWYEHLAGTNAGLTSDLTQRLQQKDLIDDKAIEELYSEHILSREVVSTSLLLKSLEALANRLTQATADSRGSAEHYARALEAGQAELQVISGADQLQGVLRKLLDSTRGARDSAITLRAELESSQKELSSMRERVGNLEVEAVKDPLTGLLNRRGFDRALAQLLEEQPAALTSSAVLMLDLDHFKRINDNYGHLFGDQVLSATAKVLNSVIKGRDIAARFGGEEFVVLLPDTPEKGAVALAEQFRQAFSRARIRRAGSEKVVEQLSVSIGVAIPLADEALEATIERADKALYRAKNEGRNCVRVAESG
ncbi:MAG: GGDEF domain-containing protein [Steroidobacteraceae bacterium]